LRRGVRARCSTRERRKAIERGTLAEKKYALEEKKGRHVNEDQEEVAAARKGSRLA